MSASRRVRSVWEGEPELPISRLGRIGVLVSLLTMGLLMVACLGFAVYDGWPTGGRHLLLWSVLYCSGLAWSWWTMRPTESRRLSHALVCGGLLVQASTYLVLSALIATWAWDSGSNAVAPVGAVRALMGLVALFALLCLLLIGPLLGVLAPLSARRGLWMTVTQLLGMARGLTADWGAV